MPAGRFGGAERRRPADHPGRWPARRCSARSSSTAASRGGGLRRTAVGRAAERHARGAARRQDGAAGMGAGAPPAAARLSRGRPRGAGACAGLRRRCLDQGARARPRPRRQQARGRAAGGGGAARTAGHHDAHHERAATRAGFVAIVGAPNAGKSTLVNALVGSKVSIVSPKVQTTRMRVIGIAMTDLPDGGRRRSCWSTRRASSASPSGGWSAPWSPPPGRARRTPTWSGSWSTPSAASARKPAPSSSG